MFMKDFSASLLIPSRMDKVHRDAERRARTQLDPSRRTAKPGRVIDAIVTSILRPRLG